ncbi:MAG: hypothetical protein QOE28_292 [Solirubrobacteraceae bacterium]|nr:hypothetical protein [Solirubrobacteraceae bacterium]
MTASTTPVFVAELHRASAQRGRLDPVYRDLSDHWTAILQRLYPVWALIGPGLADPGHIELRSRTIYLNADALLGPRAAILAGTLEPRAVLGCFGVALHETFHARHTKPWVIEHDQALASSPEAAERQLAADRRLLEEPRMEAHGVRGQPEGSLRGRFVRRALATAVLDHLLPAFTAQVLDAAVSGRALTRDMAARACVYLQARSAYGIVEPEHLAALRAIWTQVLGEPDLAALEALFARVIWIADGELDALDQAAREYRAIVGEPDPPAAADQRQRPGEAGAAAGEDGGSGPAEGDGDLGDPGASSSPGAGSLAEAIRDACAAGRSEQLTQLDADPELGAVVEHARTPAERRDAAGAGGTGRPGGRIPDRGVNRPPHPDEIQAARRYATRLRQAMTAGTQRIDRRTPGGRFNGRAYARARAEQASGRPVSTHPWQTERLVRAPIEAPHVALVIDTSGSMRACEGALGPICWILTDGLRRIGGRLATALFGDGAELLADGASPLALVPGIATGGGTAFAADALELASGTLEMANPRRPRFAYVLSDGGWSDTRRGVAAIRALAAQGVPTIHLSLGIAPLSVEAARITVISDPAQALEQIAGDTIAALRPGAPRRGR